MVTVYTLPNCVQCDQTKRHLDKGQVEYTTVDLSTDKEAYDMVVGLGYQSAPVVVTAGEHWSGFRLEKLKNLVSLHNLEEAHNV
jgi:glutaredoxin-like protein NrdH